MRRRRGVRASASAVGSTTELCQAGATLNKIAVQNVIAVVKAATELSSRRFLRNTGSARKSGGPTASSSRIIAVASSIPPRPALRASTSVSVTNCLTRRLRRAPNALRIVTSALREAPRASSTPATLAQAITSTRVAAAKQSSSTVSQGCSASFCSENNCTRRP